MATLRGSLSVFALAEAGGVAIFTRLFGCGNDGVGNGDEFEAIL